MEKLLAEVDFNQLQANATPSLAGQSIGGIISIFVGLFFPIAGFVLLGMLIYSGYQYMFSQGDPKYMQKAQQGITYSLVGFLVIFSAYLLVNYFGDALSIRQINDIFTN